MKINRGTIRGVTSGKTAKIIVKPLMTANRKQVIAVCAGAITLGIYGIVKEIFLATVEGYEKAEFDAYKEVGAVGEDDEESKEENSNG